jgi:hypothetical protein
VRKPPRAVSTGTGIASTVSGGNFVRSILKTAILSAALLGVVATTPSTMRAQDRKYHDTGHNDDHEWNSHEDKAYRMWAKENHRKYVTFDKLKDEDRESYWAWRHDHDDAKLKIVVK